MGSEVIPGELDLFKRPHFQAAIEHSNFIQIRSINSIADSSTIEFDLPISSDEYLDLQNVFIMIKGNAVKSGDGTNYDATFDNRFELINYGVNNIFDQVAIYMNGTMVSQSSKTHAYQTYIQALTENTPDEIRTSLKPGGFASPFGNDAFNANVIDPRLANIVSRSRIFTLYGKLHADIFRIDRLLLNGVTLHIQLMRAQNTFIFRGAAARAEVAAVGNVPAVPAIAASEPKLNLRDCVLFVRKVKISPRLLISQANRLHEGYKAIYPFKRTNMKVLNLPPNQRSFTLDNIYMGQLPSKIIMGIVSNDAFAGSYLTNPLRFQHHNLSFLAFDINGEMYPKTPYEPDFANNNYHREYYDFLLNLGAINSNLTPLIDMENWANNLCLYCVNFNPDFQNTIGSEFVPLAKEGFLSISLRFSENLVNALKVVCYAEFNNNIEIDAARNVSVDFT